MFRRSLTLALALPLVAALAGCSTFADNDNIARVGDTSLTRDAFEARLTDLGATGGQALPGGAVRGELTRWIQEQLLGDDEVAALYDAGVGSSGTLCVNAVVVKDQADATRVADELAGGADFATTFSKENLDQQLASTGGSLPCITAAQVTDSADVQFVQVAAGLDATSEPATAPLTGQDGNEVAWVVVLFRPYADLGVDDQDAVAAAIDITDRVVDADIFVDPRYGTFDDRTAQVIALG